MKSKNEKAHINYPINYIKHTVVDIIDTLVIDSRSHIIDKISWIVAYAMLRLRKAVSLSNVFIRNFCV